MEGNSSLRKERMWTERNWRQSVKENQDFIRSGGLQLLASWTRGFTVWRKMTLDGLGWIQGWERIGQEPCVPQGNKWFGGSLILSSAWFNLSFNREFLSCGVGIFIIKIFFSWESVLVLVESVTQSYHETWELSRVEKSMPILKNQGLLNFGEISNFVVFLTGERKYNLLN